MRERVKSGSVIVAAAIVLLGAAACSSEDPVADAAAGGTAENATSESETLRILVSNDDGVAAPGIDVLVDALAELPDTELVVVAPADPQSGAGGATTPGGVTADEAATASGVTATAVDGFPADAVAWALDGGVEEVPHVVIAGINSGQNLGALGDQHSGTVGAARVAAARGIPALAVSSGVGEEFDHEAAVPFVLDWLDVNRDALIAGDLSGDEPLLENLNVPSCSSGEVRGLVEVPMATGLDDAVIVQDCESTVDDAADDITAFNNGYATLSALTLEPAA